MVLGYLKHIFIFALTSVNFWQITSEIAKNLLTLIMGKVLDCSCTLDREHDQLIRCDIRGATFKNILCDAELMLNATF